MTDFALSTLADRPRRLAAFSSEAMASMVLAPVETVAFEAALRTHARAIPRALADGIIACDADTVQDLGAGEGESVRMVPVPLGPLDGGIMEAIRGVAPTPTKLDDLLFNRALTKGDVLAADVAGAPVALRGLSTASGPAGLVTGATTLTVRNRPDPATGCEGLAGLSRQIAPVQDMIALPLSRPDLFRRLGVTLPHGVLFCGAPGSEDALSKDVLHVIQSDLMAALERAILWPRRAAEAMRAFGLRAPRGVLLTGPPGSGKTPAARAPASEGTMDFIAVRPDTLRSQFLGEAERAVARLFENARESAPCLLFSDEFETLAPRRGGKDAVFESIVAQLLVEPDGAPLETGVSVLAATNRADAIDQALLRPGRFDLLVPFGLPDAEAGAAILSIHLSGRPVEPVLDLASLAKMTEGFSCADLAAVVDKVSWRMASVAPTETQGQVDTVMEAADMDAAAAGHRAVTRLARSDFTVSRTDA